MIDTLGIIAMYGYIIVFWIALIIVISRYLEEYLDDLEQEVK